MSTPLNVPRANKRVGCIALVNGRKCGRKPTINKLCLQHLEQMFEIFAPERIVR